MEAGERAINYKSIGVIIMSNNEFERLSINAVVKWYNDNKGIESGMIQSEDVYIVWLSKVLQNNKCMLSTVVPDGRYYEFTYNGEKNECYLDVYVKEENVCINL